MVRRTRSKRYSKKRLTRVNDENKQAGGSPAYRFHGNSGLLSQSSLDYTPLGLTSHQQNFSDHIVATSGGGRRRTRRRSKSLKRRRRSMRRRRR